MQKINLASVDLNLLVVLDALLAERNVTRAASRIGLTQPATSHALSRLRALFGDQLFVRTPKGMEPTSLALEVADVVHAVLSQVETVLSPQRIFEPASSDRTFTIGLSDYAAFAFLPALAAQIESHAPGVRLVVVNTSHALGLQMIEAGDVELIAGHFPAPPRHMAEDLLFLDDFVTAARKGHPALDGSLDTETYLQLRHLHVSLKGEPQGYLDEVIRSRGLHRNIAVTVGHFLMAPFLLQTTDAVATEPRRIMAPFADLLGLQLVRPPVDIPPFRVTQVWHRRYEADPGHSWLRSIVREVNSAGTVALETSASGRETV